MVGSRPNHDEHGGVKRTGRLCLAVAGGLFLAALPASGLPAVEFSQAIPGAAATPPLGWNSWNTFRCGINESLIEHTADAMVSSGMRDAGYRYVVVDDCWVASQRTSTGELQADPVRFPSGMRALGDYLHARGLLFGIYSSPSEATCAQTYGTYPGRTGSRGHEQIDASTFADWGVDYLKYDWCAPGAAVGEQRQAFNAMRDALRSTGRPIVYSINANSGIVGAVPGSSGSWRWTSSMSRATNDVVPAWRLGRGPYDYQGIADIIDSAALLTTQFGQGFWLDPDMLEVGVDGEPLNYPGLSTAESRTQLSMWAMMAAPLIAGNDLSTMSAETGRLLTNRGMLAIDQDPAGRTGEPLPGTEGSVWTRYLADGSVAIAFYNADVSDRVIDLDPSRLGQFGCIENVWAGTKSDLSGHMRANVAAHDTQLFRLTADCQLSSS